MRHHVSETREVHLFRRELLAHDRFDSKYDFHEMRSIVCGEIGHFFNVRLPDDAAKAGITGLAHVHYTTVLALPKQLAACSTAQFATHDVSSLAKVQRAVARARVSPRVTARRRQSTARGHS